MLARPTSSSLVIFKQDNIDAQRFFLDLNTLHQQKYGPLHALPLSLQPVMYCLILIVETTLTEMRYEYIL